MMIVSVAFNTNKIWQKRILIAYVITSLAVITPLAYQYFETLNFVWLVAISAYYVKAGIGIELYFKTRIDGQQSVREMLKCVLFRFF